MAHLRYHGPIVARWKATHDPLTYHLTSTDWLLKTQGKFGGRCSVVAKPNEIVKRKIIITNLDKQVITGGFTVERGESL